MNLNNLALSTLILSMVASSFAGPIKKPTVDEVRSSLIKTELDSFKADSVKFMNENPKKYKRDGITLAEPWSPFSKQAIARKEYVEAKYNRRGSFKKLLNAGRAEMQEGDKPENVVDSFTVKTLKDMEKLNLMAATLPETPWSGDYWAIANGIIAKRYLDSSFNSVAGRQDWKATFDFFVNNSSSSIESLSPAEKYDLIVGDKNQSLTKAMWKVGEDYYTPTTPVATWMGICHGWAPAAYMMARPKHSIKVLAADGKTVVPFYPSDIKALVSLLWAEGYYEQKFMGSRCRTKKPKTDPVSGRILSQECFDNNPGSFHQAIVNQIGVSGKSKAGNGEMRGLILDATFDFEVWNQPIYSYKYTYFNPKTLKPVKSLIKTATDEGATVNLSEFIDKDKKNTDKFKNFRSPKAVKLVGIAMDVTYTVETVPVKEDINEPKDDATKTAHYLYDLELDVAGNIVGGEWYQNAHPDFLWTPNPGVLAQSGIYRINRNDPRLNIITGDYAISGTWPVNQPVPAAWRNAAIGTASKSGVSKERQPLAKIVKELVKRSSDL